MNTARWTGVWVAGVAIAAMGALALYVGPTVFVVSKAAATSPLLATAPLALLIAGATCVVLGTIGILRTQRSPSAGGAAPRPWQWLPNAAAFAGLVLAGAALVGVLTVFIAPSIAQTLGGADPCLQNWTTQCFSAHPDYYQSAGPGLDSWTTPSARVSNATGPLFLAAFPIALAGAGMSVLALAKRATRRGLAIVGLVLGSAVAIGQILLELAFLFGGGGE